MLKFVCSFYGKDLHGVKSLPEVNRQTIDKQKEYKTMKKQEIAIAHAIRDSKYEILESLKGESLITAAWVISVIIENTEAELSLTNPSFDFAKFEQESSIEGE